MKDENKKKLYLVIIAVCLGVFRGIKEGMVMFKPNIRDHRWFKYYHRLSLLVPLTAGLFFIALSQYYHILDGWTATGMFLLSWEAFELFYSKTYHGIWIPDAENVMGAGWYLKDEYVTVLHITRLLFGITLSTRGLL